MAELAERVRRRHGPHRGRLRDSTTRPTAERSRPARGHPRRRRRSHAGRGRRSVDRSTVGSAATRAAVRSAVLAWSPSSRAAADLDPGGRAVARRHLPPRRRAARRPRGRRPPMTAAAARRPTPAAAEAAASPHAARRRAAGWMIVARKEFADHLLSVRFFVLLFILGLAAAVPLYFASGRRSARRASSASRCPAIFIAPVLVHAAGRRPDHAAVRRRVPRDRRRRCSAWPSRSTRSTASGPRARCRGCCPSRSTATT